MRVFSVQLYEKFLSDYLELSLVPATVSDHVPLRYYPEVDDFVLAPSAEITPKGRIWLGWIGGGDDERGVGLLSYSDDGGKNFAEPRMIIDPGYIPCGIHICAMNPLLWSDPNGRLWVFYMQSLGQFDGRAGVWCATCDNPDDEHPQWSSPRRLDDGAPLNKPIVTHNGDWLLPTALWPRSLMSIETNKMECYPGRLNLFRNLDNVRTPRVLRSRDQGENWECIAYLDNIDRLFDEPMLFEKNDGSLEIYMRTATSVTSSTSTDGGITWSAPDYIPQACGSTRFFLRKLASGRLLFVRNASPEYPEGPGRRSHMTAFLSEDDGKTWPWHLLLDRRDLISYPDGFQFEDGRIMIVYDRKRDSGEILSAVFTEDDIMAGKDVSGKMRLCHPVIRSRTMQMKGANLAYEGENYHE